MSEAVRLSGRSVQDLVELPLTRLRFSLADKLLRINSPQRMHPVNPGQVEQLLMLLSSAGVPEPLLDNIRDKTGAIQVKNEEGKITSNETWDLIAALNMLRIRSDVPDGLKKYIDKLTMGWRGLIFPAEELKMLVKELHDHSSDPSLEEEIRNAHKAIMSGKATKDIRLNSPEKQLAWAAHLLFLVFNPWLIRAWPEKNKKGNQLAKTLLWKQLLDSHDVKYLRAVFGSHIYNLLRKSDLMIGWGAPGTWFSFSVEPAPGRINCDLLYSMIVGFDHARACAIHEIGHAVQTKGIPDYIQEMSDAMTELEGISAQEMQQELKLKQYFLNAAEDNCVNRFTKEIGEVFGQDYGYSLNYWYTAIGDVGRRYLRKDDPYLEDTPENRFSNLTFIISRIFLANNDLFPKTNDGWESIMARPDWIIGRNRNNPDEFLNNKDSFAQLLEMAEEIEHFFPELREMAGGPEYYSEQAERFALKRFEMIRELWDLYAADIMEQILEKKDEDETDNALDQFNKEMSHTPPPPKKKKQEDQEKKKEEKKEENPNKPTQSDNNSDKESDEDLEGDKPDQQKPEDAGGGDGEDEEQSGDDGSGTDDSDAEGSDDESGMDDQSGNSEDSAPSDPFEQGEDQQKDEEVEKEQPPQNQEEVEKPDDLSPDEENRADEESQANEKETGGEQEGDEGESDDEPDIDLTELNELLELLKKQLAELQQDLREEEGAEHEVTEDEEDPEAEMLREIEDKELEPEQQENDGESDSGDTGEYHGGKDDTKGVIEREFVPDEPLASIQDLMEMLKEEEEKEAEEEEKQPLSREDREDLQKLSFEVPKALSLDELAHGSWENFAKRVAMHSPVIAVMAQALIKLKDAQLKLIHRISKKHNLIPPGGDLRRFDQEKMNRLMQSLAKQERFDVDSLSMFRKDDRRSAPSRPTRIILIDGSRSMTFGSNPLPMDKAIQEAVIDYMASKMAGYDTFISMFGPKNPIMLAEPGDNPVEIGKRIEKVHGGLNTMTYLAPSLLQTIEAVAYRKKFDEPYVGFTNFVIYSDGDIDDPRASRELIEQIFLHAPKTTFDFVLITHKHATPMDAMIRTIGVDNPVHIPGLVRGNAGRQYPMALSATYKLTNRLRNTRSGFADPAFLRSGQFKRLLKLLIKKYQLE